MANCGEYLLLTPKERTEYIGMLIHACQSDAKYFEMGQRIIKAATRKGIFEGVTINPIEQNNINEPLNEVK